MTTHVVLLGDSIFDNATYVPGEPAVIEQLRTEMPAHWRASLLAVDGDVISDIGLQLQDLPDDATHLVISVGGNDALGDADILERVASIDKLQTELGDVLHRFRTAYSMMLDEVASRELPTAVCTIYDQCPFPEQKWREFVPVALAGYNECIIQQAEIHKMPVIELREICCDEEDYSAMSPIEPSALGGIKIVAAIIRLIQSNPWAN